MSGKKILLVKMSSLGDVVHALPAVQDAVQRGHEVDWVVEEGFADVARLHPGVRRVLPVAWRRWRRDLAASGEEMTSFLSTLRERQYDLIIDSQGLIKSATVALLARGARAGFSHTSAREPWASFAYRSKIRVARTLHAIDRQRLLFAGRTGLRCGAWRCGCGFACALERRAGGDAPAWHHLGEQALARGHVVGPVPGLRGGRLRGARYLG